MRRVAVILLLLALAHAPWLPAVEGTPLDRVEYRLRIRDPRTHLLDVSVAASAPGSAPVDFQMPAWSPGRYVIYDFARNVQEVTAADGSGHELPVTKIDKQTWRVVPPAGRVTLSYKVFANDLSGTFSHLDARHANINGASVFMYVVGRKGSPVRLSVDAPPGWAVFGALSTTPSQTTFEAPSYDLLVDMPTEAAPDFELRAFEIDGITFRVLVHQLGDDRTRSNRLAEDLRSIVAATLPIVGPLDTDRYTFIIHFDPDALHDGMEHLTSTQIVRGSSLDDDRYEDLLTVAAHELFHAWNVKRLRPVELGPWDYTRENYTTSLWIAEGLTSYYADRILLRAGLLSPERFLDALERQIAVLQSTPGRKLLSLEQASFDTWLYTATRGRQRSNPALPVNYYNKGHVVGAMLDLEIRRRTAGTRSLDDVFRTLYRRFYVEAPASTYYLKGRGYRGEDFLAAVNEIAGSDFGGFFARYVSGVEEIDYDALLGNAALRLVRKRTNDYEIVGVEPADGAALSVRRAWLGSD